MLTIVMLTGLVALAGCANIVPTPEGGPGALAEEYLAGGGVLIIELDHSPGAPPTSKVQAALREEIGRITQKTVEIRVSRDLPARGDTHTYSLDELRDLHDAHQDERARSGVAVLHLLFVDGRVVNERTAGVAYLEDAAALGIGLMRENTCSDGGGVLCLGQPEFSNAVRAVAVHEVGHLLGLVNLGLPMVTPHEDREHPGHSSSDRSVMWHEVETANGLQNLFDGGAGIPWQFDSNDIQDARAIQ